MRRLKLKCWSQIVWLLGSSVTVAAPLFESEAILDVELRGPLQETIRDRRDPESRPFELLLGDDRVAAEVRVRGNSRKSICDFPPLRLELSDSSTSGTVLDGQDTLKLVSHCKAQSAYTDDLIEEYAAYRTFLLLTDKAFNVRLLRVRYVDTGRPAKEPLERYAFVLESAGALTERIGGTAVRQEAVTKRSLDRDHLATVFVFQYLIGNTDWSLVSARGETTCCHNGELIDVAGRILYVPYDFDFAGFVGARYAKPQPDLGIRSVRTRRYRGYCLDGLDLEAAVRRVVVARPAIFELLAALPGADSPAGRERVRYLESFFDEARDIEGLARKFEQACIG